MRPDDDASKTKFSTQTQRNTTNRKANITESEFIDNEYVNNMANFIEEVTEDAEERLAASVHETSYPDERMDLIVNASAGRGPLPPGDVMSLLSDKTDRRSPVRTPGHQEQTSASKPKGSIEKLAQQLNVFGKKKGGKRKGNMHLTNPFTDPGYAVSSHSRANKCYSLIDRGANGGIQGDDMCVVNIAQPERCIDVTGIDDHEIPKLRIGTAAGVATSQSGEVILVFHQYALHGRGKTIHSSSQLEHYKNVVNDRPLKLGGTQSITTNDGHTSPSDFQNGSPSLKLRPYMDEEWDTFPTVIMTEDMEWDPRHYDQEISNEKAWYDKQPDDLQPSCPCDGP